MAKVSITGTVASPPQKISEKERYNLRWFKFLYEGNRYYGMYLLASNSYLVVDAENFIFVNSLPTHNIIENGYFQEYASADLVVSISN